MTKVVTGAAQGDILIIRYGDIPASATLVHPESGRLIVARGEATGHHHSFRVSPGITLFRDEGTASSAPLYVKATEPAVLEHQEHDPITFAPGTYKIVRQRVARSAIGESVLVGKRVLD